MVMGPYFGEIKHGQPGMSPDELCAIARESGQRLVAEIERAESASSRWSNEGVGFALVGGALDRCLARLAATGCWGKENQLPSGELWTVAGHLLEVSWLQHRARFKPRGYAGDYEMFERFWQRQTIDHPLGRLFDRYFQGQAAVEAVRGRTEQLGAALVECWLAVDATHPFHVVSVGCGPTIDILCALEVLPASRRSQLTLTLLDLDQAALEHARQRLSGLLASSQITSVRENLYRLADKPQSARLLDGADFLLCSGLFDYLPDPSAQKLLGLFWQRLAAGGTLFVGNFAPHNPTRAYMEWIGNWYLIYRTAAELQSLAEAADVPLASFSLGAERLGINLFLHAWK